MSADKVEDGLQMMLMAFTVVQGVVNVIVSDVQYVKAFEQASRAS